MQYLNRTQFSYATRYHRVGLGKADIQRAVAVVRRIQEGEMRESGKVGDVTFVFWICLVNNPGVVLRCLTKGLLAEKAEANIRRTGQTVTVDGNIGVGRDGQPVLTVLQLDIEEVRPASEDHDEVR